MIAQSVKFCGYRCFKNDWSGFNEIKPINVIIGRNNTGKSHLLDLARALCEGLYEKKDWYYQCTGILDEASLRARFSPHTSGGRLGGNHWRSHGQYFVDIPVKWETDIDQNITNIEFDINFDYQSPAGSSSTEERFNYIKGLLKEVQHALLGRKFCHLLADRDIRTEEADTSLQLQPNGSGATNIIRRYIVTSNAQYPRELIQRDLLQALNQIFGSDGLFSEIQVKVHDEPKHGFPANHWEVYLGEDKKGLISLSRSGSGLKTVILVLLNLLVVPKIYKKARSNYVFAFEELENNLHPALLRRLFQYIEKYAIDEGATIFLTTHSSTALDVFGLSSNAQIIHVTHDGESARAQTVSAHFDHLGVISELGAKPSDLLQANGIVWVEGPSDCIYLNRWIDLVSNGELQEGRDYLCAFYGGSLLARTQFKSPVEAERDLVNLFRVNPNIVVICDGDRSAHGARVKDRVRRIRSEVLQIPNAHIWVTQAREIENYLPGEVLAKAIEITSAPDPQKYDLFFPRKGQPGTSYIEAKLNRKSIDKMDLSVLSVQHMTKANMQPRFDWLTEFKPLCKRFEYGINSWQAYQRNESTRPLARSLHSVGMTECET